MKNKVLIFNGYYIPARKYGGPLTSIKHVVASCSDEFEFYIVSADHDVGSSERFCGIKEGWQKIDSANVIYVRDGELDYKRKRISKLIDSVNPDMIWFSGFYMPGIELPALAVCKKKNIPVLISPRGEVSEDRISIKAYKKKPYILLTRLFGYYSEAFFHATSKDEVAGLKKYIKAKDTHIFESENIGTSPAENVPKYDKKSGELHIVFISRIHMVKNIKLAVSAVAKMKSVVFFDIYGPMESPEYWAECEKIAEKADKNITIKYCGSVDPSEIGAVFGKYDCFLFPTINENYGHAIAESLANGCPVVISRGTTPWDGIDGEAGYICDLKNEFEFTNALENIAKMSGDELYELKISAYNYYKKIFETNGAVRKHKDMFKKIIM